MSRPKYHFYWAAPYDTNFDKEYNKTWVEKFEKLGYKIYFPQRDSGEADIDYKAVEIKQRNITGIKSSKAVIAILKDVPYNEGVVYEVGYAEALGKSVYIVSSSDKIENAMFCLPTQQVPYIENVIHKLQSKLILV